MRVLFFGNTRFSLPVLEALVAEDVEVVGIVVPVTPRRGDRPWRRPIELAKRQALRVWRWMPEPIARRAPSRSGFLARMLAVAEHAGAPLLSPGRVSHPRVVESLRRLRPDVTVMAGFDQILGPSVIDGIGPVLNVHPSLLPRYRGPAPQFWIIHNGEREGGVTVHRVDRGVDSGPILAQERFRLEPWLTGGELYERSSREGGRLVAEVLRAMKRGSPREHPQTGEPSYFGRVQPEHRLVAFTEPAPAAYNRARAADPADGSRLLVPREWWSHECETSLARMQPAAGILELSLHEPALFPEYEAGPPGAIRHTQAGGVAVQCTQGVVVFRSARAVRPAWP